MITSKTLNYKDYHAQLKQFIKASFNKPPEEMKRLFIQFLPSFIAKTDDDINIAVDTRNLANETMKRSELNKDIRRDHRRSRKHSAQFQKSIAHLGTLSVRIRAQVDHWEKMRVLFDVSLSEIEGLGDLGAEHKLNDLFPELYSEKAELSFNTNS